MLSVKHYNRLMIVGVYFTFIEPLKGLFMVPSPGFYMNLQELGLVLFSIGYFMSGRDASSGTFQLLSRCALVLLGVIATVEFFKLVQYGVGSPVTIIRVNRPSFNGLCALFILALGLRPGAKLIINHVFLAILISSTLAFVFGLLGMRPTSPFVAASALIQEAEEFRATTGRFGGIHSNLGVAMVLLLYFYGRNSAAFVISKKWRLVMVLSAVMTMLTMVASFNRTLFAATVLALSMVLLFEFRVKAFFVGLVSAVLLVGATWVAVATNSEVERQFSKRIAIVMEGPEAILENVYYGNRENIYSQAAERIREYPILGLPYGVPAFVAYKDFSARPFFWTDISLLNAYLRYGVLAGVLMMLVVFLLLAVAIRGRNFFPPGELNMYAKMLGYSVIVYVPISLNYDVLLRHSAIVFFAMVALHLSYYREVSSTRLRNMPRRR